MISALKALDAKVNALSGVNNSQYIQNVNAQSLCIGETCINEDQLKQILKLINTNPPPQKSQEIPIEISPEASASSAEI
jgi:coproporphyrinogen III oxidase-like Fe-S oxidoreductase